MIFFHQYFEDLSQCSSVRWGSLLGYGMEHGITIPVITMVPSVCWWHRFQQ